MSENSRLDKTTYESSKIYLKATLEHMLAAGRSAREHSEFAMEKFGADFLPYLQQFLRDVGQGRITVKGLTRSARSALLGHHVTAEQRANMIREAAYLRAEQRGFVGGSGEQDWLEAERQIDLQLAHEAGLVVKGSKALASVRGVVEKDLAHSKQAVMRWVDEKFTAIPALKKAPRKKKKAAPAAKSTTRGKRASNKTGQRPGVVKQAAKKKSPAKKTTSARTTAATKKQAASTTKKKAATTKKKAATTKKKTATTKNPASARKQAGTRQPLPKKRTARSR